MPVSKVVYGSRTLIDLTSDTVTADVLKSGFTAHDKSGAAVIGTMSGGGSLPNLHVDAGVAGASVTATCGTSTVSGTTNENGHAYLSLDKDGTWVVTGMYSGSGLSTESVDASAEGGYWTVALAGRVIEVRSVEGAHVTVTNGATTYTATLGSSKLFTVYVNAPGTWTVSCTNAAYDDSKDVDVDGFCKYDVTVGTKSLTHYGTASELSVARYNLTATSVGDYALFGGGIATGSVYQSVVDVYDKSLTKESNRMIHEAYGIASASLGDNAVFAGGYSSDGSVKTAYSFDSSLTRKTIAWLTVARYGASSATVGDYILFAGGITSGTSGTNSVNYYDRSLTLGSPANQLSNSKKEMASASIGDYALFCGGYVSSAYATANAYNSSLTRSTPASLSKSNRHASGTRVGGYALIGGGFGADEINYYDPSLTRGFASPMGNARVKPAATTVGSCALFGGGKAVTNYSLGKEVDSYDTSLTHMVEDDMGTVKYGLAATTVGRYALFGGGSTEGSGESSVNSVEVYEGY